MPNTATSTIARVATAIAVLGAAAAHASPAQVSITIENLSPGSSISFAPLRIGFHGGVFDAFDLGGVATAPIISVAEGGSGVDWFPAFAAADPGATLGTVGGLLTPGATRSASFMVDRAANPFFTFATMAVPSNDFFIGNDDPIEYRLFDAMGHLLINQIDVLASEIWDAGSEVFDPAAAAFVGNNDLRSAQNSVVALNFAELAGFNGLTTGAGYVFQSGLEAGTGVYRISFEVAAVPEPETYAMMLAGLAVVGWTARRRRRPA